MLVTVYFQGKTHHNMPWQKFKWICVDRCELLLLSSRTWKRVSRPLSKYYCFAVCQQKSLNITFSIWAMSEWGPKINRISVSRLFQISGSAWRSLIFVCSNFSKNRTCLFGLWFYSPKWLQMARLPNWRKSENCRLTISNIVPFSEFLVAPST